MIVDIVPLPRRLERIRSSRESITSEEPVAMPTPELRREFGYWEPDDSCIMIFGGVHHVITGKDTPFRYKIVEPTKYGLAEYFVLTTSPINVLQPWKSKNVQLICPWVVLEDQKTLRIRKFILWNGVFDLMHYETEDNIHDVPAEAVIVNELRNLAKQHGREDLLDSLRSYPSDCSKLLISEEKLDRDNAIDDLTKLASNITAYNSMLNLEDPCHWCDIGEVTRGVNLPGKWNDFRELVGCSFLNHVIYGKTTLGSVRHLFGIMYDAHVFQRPFAGDALDPYVELSIHDNTHPDLFGVLKYVERLPYSEFVLEVNGDGVSMAVLNPHDPIVKIADNLPLTVQESIKTIGNSLRSGYPSMTHATIHRSWGEEVYITITMLDGTELKFYFDLVSASLGSRTLIRDYNGYLF